MRDPLTDAVPGLARAAAIQLERRAARVNLAVEIGVNPDSHPRADAGDRCPAAL